MIYFIEAEGLNLVKIGFIHDDVTFENRIRAIRNGCPVPLRILAVTAGGATLEKKRAHDFYEPQGESWRGVWNLRPKKVSRAGVEPATP